MSEKALEIFRLCERLAELLGDKEAIADLKILLIRHPEMFENKEEVREVIKKVVSEPDIAVDANRDKRDYVVIKVAKILDNEKMADVVIKNQDGINEIFHANKKRVREFERLRNKENLLQVETPIPSTHQLNGLELMNNSSGEKTLSVKDENTIPNPSQKSQIQNEQKTLINEMLKTQDELNAMPRVRDFAKDFEKDLEQSFNVRIDDENLQKDNKFKLKTQI